MQQKENLYEQLCSYENLELAFKKARKRKTTKLYVLEFEKNLKQNLLQLQTELLLHAYKPKPLETFILRDPKTRKISKSDFRDRIVHHALCNVIQPIFEKSFIHDSYANQIGKGTLKAIQRFDEFKLKVTKNNTRIGFVLKCDIRQYFDNIDHDILLSIIKKKISDEKILWLIKIIFSNYCSKENNKGMPLGNLTSQFFANVYLNELDQFVKHTLKAKYYIRYVDDFVIFDNSKVRLEEYKPIIEFFLKEKLQLKLHPLKSRIIKIGEGTDFLGVKIFMHHKRIKKKNIRKFQKKLQLLTNFYEQKKITYDTIYDFLEGWIAYAINANTYHLRKGIIKSIEQRFLMITAKEINRYIFS